MGSVEYQKMVDSDKVLRSITGTTHVAYHADVSAFGKQAKMEFYMLDLIFLKNL